MTALAKRALLEIRDAAEAAGIGLPDTWADTMRGARDAVCITFSGCETLALHRLPDERWALYFAGTFIGEFRHLEAALVTARARGWLRRPMVP